MKPLIKVAIADGNCLFRAGIRSVLSEREGILVSAEITNLQHLETLFESGDVPDVLIANLAFAIGSSLDFLTQMVSKYPNIPVIVLGSLSEEAYAARVLRAGGSAYLKLDCSAEELIEAVGVVKSGRMYLTNKASTAVIEQLQNRNGNQLPHASLSDREYQIFTMICQGRPLVKIGEEFGISVKTVSTYRSRILKKMSMQSNAELIQYAVRSQIIDGNGHSGPKVA